MTERRIQNAIWSDRGQQSALMCPNYTPREWWECDVWMVTKAGYSVEFEIKVSLEDFKADAKKFQKRFIREPGGKWFEGKDVVNNKHDLLAARDKRGPSRFYFVVPASLELRVDMVPEWAGLITAEKSYWIDYNGKKQFSGALRLCEMRPAPKLHTQKVDPKILEHCRGVFFYRYWNLRVRLKDEKSLTEPAEGAESPHISGGSPEFPSVQVNLDAAGNGAGEGS